MIKSLLLSMALMGQCPGGVCPPRASMVYRPVAIAPAPASVTYFLDDARGVRWTHADPAYLRAWVARVNASVR